MNSKQSLYDMIPDNLLVPQKYDPRWETSKLKSLKMAKPKSVGAMSERITKSLMSQLGHKVEPRTNTGHDMILDGKKTEEKGSCLTCGSNDKFSFLQFRPDQDAQQYLLSCYYPDKVELYLLSKAHLEKNIILGKIKKQHGGNKANSRTYSFNGNPKDLFGIERYV